MIIYYNNYDIIARIFSLGCHQSGKPFGWPDGCRNIFVKVSLIRFALIRSDPVS